MRKRVAIQGVAGSYHDIAARKYFGEEIEVVDCLTFREVVETVTREPETAGMMAIENTIAGSLLQNHELIRGSGAWVMGEIKLRISHTLAALPDTRPDEIKEVDSHPIALAQCMDFLNKLKGIRLIEAEDTALSARRIAEEQRRGVAAVCSKLAAETFGLAILAEGIETNKRNFTRFLVLENSLKRKKSGNSEELNKASLVFSLPHSAGSLSQVLSILSFYSMSLTKIQSLPVIGREWEYLFYIDLTFKEYARYRQSLDAILPLISDFRILGEYREGGQYV
ncbi:MAG: prephenate dehydratase [Tannerellaceae bacterium]|nr:prephenate dehydratase [Tannerellaceae bacterium]